MKKSTAAIIIYMIIGIALITTGVTQNIDYYSSLMIAMGTALFLSGIVQLFREYRDSRPEYAAAAQEKKRRQAINLKDERKVQLRFQAGYATFQITVVGCFIGSFIAAVVRANARITLFIFLFAVAQYIIAGIIYKYLCRKM